MGMIRAATDEGGLPQVAIEYWSDHQALLERSRVEEGMLDLIIAARLDFDNAEASARLLNAAQQTENPHALVVALQGFLANAEQQDAELHSWLAAALLAADRPHEALVHSREALRLGPESAALLTTHGDIQAALGQGDGARRAYEQAMAVDPAGVEQARRGLSRLHQSAAIND